MLGRQMFGEVFRFELRYQLKRISIWLYFLLMTGLLLQLTIETFFDGAREAGYFFNAPFVIASAAIMGSFIGMLVTAGVAGDAASRDVQLRLSPLMYTTPVGKRAYLGGRFAAAFIIAAGVMLAVPLGQWLALLLPGLEPELIGPFRPEVYALIYVSVLLPTAFITTALMFSAALLTRRSMAGFAVAAGLFVAAIFTNVFFAQIKAMWALASVLDPFGVTIMSEMSNTRTPLQKGEMLIGLEPVLLANRALWIGIAVAVLAFAYSRFSFAHEAGVGGGARWRWLPTRRTRVVADPLDDAPVGDLARATPAALPHAAQRFDVGARVRQVLAITARSFRDIVFARGFLVVVAVAVVVVLAGTELMEHMGVPIVPVTGFIAQRMGDAQDFFGFVAPLMCVVYAGELVWRERDAGLGPIVDATPLHDWVPLLGKGLGLGLALAVWQGLLMVAGVITQLRMGHADLQPMLWLQMVFGLGLPGHLLFAVVAITVHVLVNQKIAGNVAALTAYGLMLFAPKLGIEHPMLIYASDPGWAYSDLRGFGTSLGPVLWFTLYWAGWALLFALITRLLWVRGAEQDFKPRLAIARLRVSAPVIGTAAVAVAMIVGFGGYVFHNINVRNTFATSAQNDAARADYERRYARYADVAQPTLASTKLRIELYPAQGSATIDVHHVFVNRTSGPIDTLHVETSASVDTGPLRFDRPATLVEDDTTHRHRIVRLSPPLQPGESLGMDALLRFGGRGFSANGVDDSIAARASHFEQDWLPVLGYQNNRELSDAGMRRKLGLPPRPEIPQLGNVRARHDIRGHERVQVDTTIGTVAGQIAVAPGILQRSWSEGGRRYFHYVTDAPIDNGYGIYSAEYAVHDARWKDVAIRIYHHPAHAANVPRMAQSVQASLERYTRAFGPYPSRQLTVIETAGYALSARAHATSVRFFEGLALMNPDADWRKVDFVFAVMAHEMGHQWWGNQVVPAPVAGAPFVAESLAWYSALGVIGDAKGEAHLERFLGVMREDYLDPRARDGVPLLESADWFTAYRLGPFSMVALRDAVGEARVNLALRRFMEKYGDGQPPLPTSLDLYAELKAVTPAGQHELLADLFERNTFWNLRTDGVAAERAGDGWRVTLEVNAQKVSVDKKGKESRRPLNELIEIGVYGPGTDEAPGEALYLRKHRLHAGTQRITVTVRGQPATAGVDPRHVLIDTRRRDNVRPVVMQR